MAKGCVVYMRVGRVQLVAGRWVKAEEEQKRRLRKRRRICSQSYFSGG